MGKYLDILARAEAYDKNDRNDKSPLCLGRSSTNRPR